MSALHLVSPPGVPQREQDAPLAKPKCQGVTRAAVRWLQALLDRGDELLTLNDVLVESFALLQARLGIAAARKLAEDSSAFLIEWVDEDIHAAGLRQFQQWTARPGARQA